MSGCSHDVPRLLARWQGALDSREAGPAFNAARELTRAYALEAMPGDELAVLERTLNEVGRELAYPLRRRLVEQIAEVAWGLDTRRAMLALAKEVALGDESAWRFTFDVMSRLGEPADNAAMRECFYRIEQMAQDVGWPTWAEIESDPVFASQGVR